MRNGYKILWTDYALNELTETFLYLEKKLFRKRIKTTF